MDFLFLHVAGRTLRQLMGRIRSFIVDSRGVSTVEYALIVVAVVAVVGGGAAVLSGAFGDLFETIETDIAQQADDMTGLEDDIDVD